ncbi:hypothetical protein [Falsiphaeobacter marinintestinus]|uniref:hypothetical protein n=1 Tax=Falsiphaeobacter marinintestinus TaxID=1492905 RepID=UPI001FE78352|nr:hypothetical protein [Phaeobacter marinintestinus]
MRSICSRLLSASICAFALSGPALAQAPTGWGHQIDGLAIFQGSADLSGGGTVSASRAFVRAGSLYRFGDGNSIGVSASVGQFNYDFSNAANQPWTDIRDVRLSAPMRFRVGDTGSVFLAPQVRWDYQSGVAASDGQTYGIFAGIAWKVSDRLTIGPAFGAYTQLGEDGTELFPALLIDWDVADKWNLSTGTGPGATRGPGVTLSYAHTEKLEFALSVRSESVRFRLDGTGLAPNGVGEDKSIPVALSVSYRPNPGMSFSAFVGAEFNGELTLDDAAGTEISRQSYETAPIAGLAFRIRF